MMCAKTIFVLALAVLAIVLLVVVLVTATRASNPGVTDKIVEQAFKVVKAIVTALIILVGGGAAATLLTSCSAKRAIVVQGSMTVNHSSDSASVVISTQETYTGLKKK